MFFINIIDSILNSNTLFFVLLIILIAISIVMFYLIYTQNKEVAKALKRKDNSLFGNNNGRCAVKSIEYLDEDKPAILEVTKQSIPDKLELTQSLYLNSDTMELQSITKELESMSKERKIQLTPFEEEQEEKAIISYDELVNTYDESISSDDINNSLPTMNKENTKDSYKHEEEYLASLKQLQKLLN